MTTPPAKIKAFLATIKDTVLDAEECSLQECYLTLLRLEVLQRGVLVNEKDPSKILEAVRSTAGKALLEGSMPLPLLAGSAAIAGRVAEQAVQEIVAKGLNLEKFDAALIKSARDRCDEVQEERLKILLRLANPADDESPTIFQSQLLLIAEGYFYRAASFQPDAPPMWKRAWDVILDRNRVTVQQSGAGKDVESSWEAVTALTHLRRIASLKGNSKRAAELSLLLAESLLDTPSQAEDKVFKPTIQAFVAPFRPTEPLPADKSVKRATKALNDSSFEGQELSDDDAFLRAILKLRIEFATEDADIELLAQEEFDIAKNRGKGGATLVKIRSTMRQKQLACSAENSSLDTSAQVLRDALLAKPATEVSAEHGYRVRSGYALTRRYLSRQRDLAQAVALVEYGKDKSERGWLSLAAFMEPILAAFQKSTSWDPTGDHDSHVGCIEAFLDASSIAEERDLLETAAVLVPSIEWMCCARNQNKLLFPLTMLSFTQDVLSVLCTKATKVYKELQSSTVVKSMLDAGEKGILILESTLATTRAVLVLGTGSSGRSLVAAAVTRGDKADSGGQEFGSSFLEFLVSWSGIHQSPWQFCSLSEARNLVKKARDCLERATTDWGRSASPLERILLDLGQADVEGTSFTGGMIGDARKLYAQVIDAVDQLTNLESFHGDLIRSRCYSGLAYMALNHQDSEEFESVSEKGEGPDSIARMGLDLLQQMSLNSEVSPFYLWGSQSATESAIRFQVAKTRQLIADALIRNGSAREAQKFLEDAVQDAPADSGAAFAFGAFRLRMMFFGGERSSVSDKAAQTQLLKAAKLDSSKAGPFALLGYWFEYFQDTKRAIGCYSKALLLEPTHPVAGRGLLRLKEPDGLKTVFDNAINAINSDSSLNGWAWRAVGLQKAMVEGEDELAIVSFLKALRSRDIEHPEAESLAIFFSSPMQPQLSSTEMMEVSAELAACYRRLGRYTAAIRTFHAAIDQGGEEAPPSLLCACAQSELELGLFDDAVDKFTRALENTDKRMHSMAAYGQGLARLSMAHRDLQDGKAGAAFVHVQKAIQGCHDLDLRAGCIQKLLGDLFSFGASLPPDVFDSDGSVVVASHDEKLIQAQLSFVSSGEIAYRASEDCVVAPTENKTDTVRACLVTDLGSNLLYQAQMLSFWCARRPGQPSAEPEHMFQSSAKEFRRAIDLSPHYAPAWCGLGCAISSSDPLLAQHAFCRSLELDTLYPDAYANLGFLYTKYDAFVPSGSVSDALTQVADTPMMWINRALVLERQAAVSFDDDGSKSEDRIRQAADAYRAALQVGKHPSAMLGLAMSCRMASHSGKVSISVHLDQLAMKESQNYITEYLGAVGNAEPNVSVLSDALDMERRVYNYSPGQEGSIEKGSCQLSTRLEQLESAGKDSQNSLDLDVIRGVVATAALSGAHDGAPVPKKGSESLTSAIIHEPSRGDLWLDLTKDLTQKINGGGSEQTLASAQRAARRATMILMHNLVEPSSDHPVDAEDVSDALALKYWLDNMDMDSKPSEDSKPRSNVEVQRALLMCPGNPVARSALSLPV